jgi:MoaA/NifB/PqqE/SkfB family radical SAM enzyme
MPGDLGRRMIVEFSHPLSMANSFLNRLEIRLKRVRILSRPVELTLEPTVECNSNCLMCNRNFDRREAKDVRGFLSWDIFRKVKPHFKYVRRLEFSGFGEPLLHPEYLSMMEEIKRSGPFIYLFTNGMRMDENVGRGLVDVGADQVFISMGGAKRETYARIRGIDAFDQVIDNIKSLTAHKKNKGRTRPRLAFNVVLMKTLVPELEALVRLAADIGVEQIGFPNLVVQGESMAAESVWNDLEPAKKSLQKAGRLARQLRVEFITPSLIPIRSICWDFFRRLFITWDGKVLSCPLERYLYGDIQEITIDRMWNSPGLVRLRKEFYKKGLDELCAKCTCWDNRPEAFLDPWTNSRASAIRLK